MVIENGVLKELDSNYEALDVDFTQIKEIGDSVFSDASMLSDVKIPRNVTRIGKRAFSNCYNIKSLKLSEGLKIIDNKAFERCDKLTKVIIPSSIEYIGRGVFIGCKNLESITFPNIELNDDIMNFYRYEHIYISKDGKTVSFTIKPSQELQETCYSIDFNDEDFDAYYKFLKKDYRENYINLKLMKEKHEVGFIPPDYVLQLFPSKQMKNFFINGNDKCWGRLVKTLKFDTLPAYKKEEYLPSLMKIYYALGGFSENESERDKAFKYIVDYVPGSKIKDEKASAMSIAAEIYNQFSEIEITGPYNKTFSQFFMKYYKDDPEFMIFDFSDRFYTEYGKKNYIAQAHNQFKVIQKYFPHMEVKGNTKRSLLTPLFVAEHSFCREYYGVKKGNEDLAKLIGQYCYSQEQFNEIQDIYETAKAVKDAFIISADKAKEDSCVTFRILEKDDPLGFVIGDITNCCQTIGRGGESCVKDGFTNPNAGFMVFEQTVLDEKGNPTGEKQILGQAYIWYDPETKTVCYDNIEIPKSVLQELEKGDKENKGLTTETLMHAVEESAIAIMKSMNKDGIMVEQVTTGAGFNDLVNTLKSRYERIINPKARNRGYWGYSDALDSQFVISTYKDVTEKYASATKDLIADSLKDLKAIALTTETQNIK